MQAPWFVKDTDFSEVSGKLDIYLEYQPCALFICPLCQNKHPVHDFETHTVNVAVPWARPQSGLTLLFEELTMELANHMPLSTAEGILSIYDNRIMRTVKHYVDEVRLKVDMSRVKQLSVDETSTLDCFV